MDYDEAKHRHAGYYLTVVQECGTRYANGNGRSDVQQALVTWDAEWSQIHHAFEWLSGIFYLDDTLAALCSEYVAFAYSLLLLRLPPPQITDWLQTAIHAEQQLGNHQRELEFRYLEARMHLLTGAHDHAEHLAGAVFKELPDNDTTGLRARLQLLLARISDERGNRDATRALLRSAGANNVLEETPSRLTEAVFLSLRGKPPDEQRAYLENALARIRRSNRLEDVATALAALGRFYVNQDEYKQAEKHLEEARDIAGRLGDQRFLGTVLGNLGLVYSDTGRASEAITLHKKALHISQSYGNRVHEASDYINLGVACVETGDRDAAEAAFEQAEKIYESLNLPDRLQIARANLRAVRSPQHRLRALLIRQWRKRFS